MIHFRRLLSLCLAMLLCIGLLPVITFAENELIPATKRGEDNYLIGDVNGDEKVTIKDRLILTRFLANWQDYLDKIQSKNAADINGDGNVTAMDRLLLTRYLSLWQGYEKYFTDENYYHVIFDTNASGVHGEPSSLYLKSGSIIPIPEPPSKDSFIFSGWYTDSICSEPYNFEIELSGDITLYAKWEEIADDITDPFDEYVAESDIFILSASEMDVPAGSETSVVFSVNTTLTTPFFEVFCNGNSTGVELVDTGDYSYHHDDIPSDGCYSGVYYINEADSSELSFVATAMIGDETIWTNEVVINVYTDYTEDEMEEMEQVVTEIEGIIETAKYSDDYLNTVVVLLTEFLNEKEKEGVIYNIDHDSLHYLFSFTFSSSDTDHGIQYYAPVHTGIASVDASGEIDSTTSYLPNLDYVTYKEKALLMNYCTASDPDQQDRLNGYRDVVNKLEVAGFEVATQYSVTVDDFKKLQDYQFIMTDCHGSFYLGSPVICTSQKVTDWSQTQYKADINAKRIYPVTTVDANNNPNGTYYWIKPKLFDDYYSTKKMKCSIFYLNVCEGAYQNTQLVDAIIKAGADSVIAYDETVYTFYGINMLNEIVDSLLKSNTVLQAVNDAKGLIGNDDFIGYGIYLDPAVRKTQVATCGIYGSTTATIHAELKNGNFDKVYGISLPSLSYWRLYGDARAIMKLAGITPKSSPGMAIVSSGFGAQNGETTSIMYQTVLIPEDADVLSFSYDVVSEEPMEWVGTQYNDMFVADILSTDGTVLNTLAYESVNTSEWHLLSGIDFPDGDDTAYHTRWKDVEFNISEYRNQLIVLRFAVQDAGDSIYDTAVVVDTVKISSN